MTAISLSLPVTRAPDAPSRSTPALPTPSLPTTQPRYLDAINVVRWVASIGVVVTHCTQEFAGNRSLAFAGFLAELHATRAVFFLVSALVMTYAYDLRRPFPWRRFYGRRLRWLFLPFLVWTAVYVGVSFTGFAQFSRANVHPAGVVDEAGQAAGYLYSGVGHLYHVAVLLQFCLVFPLVLWVVRRTRRFHLLVLAASVLLEVWLMLRVAQNPAANRAIVNYQLYLVAGCLAGARFDQLVSWARRWRRELAWLVVLVIVGTEASVVYAVHHGVANGAAIDPLQGRFIPLNLASFVGLYLLGDWWQRTRHRSNLIDRIVKGGADNSFAVYLSQGIFLDVLLSSGIVARLESQGLNRLVAVLVCAALVWSAGALLGSVLARTPLAWSVGRARRRIVGGAPAGRFEAI